jgi:hypothetical protein
LHCSQYQPGFWVSSIAGTSDSINCIVVLTAWGKTEVETSMPVNRVARMMILARMMTPWFSDFQGPYHLYNPGRKFKTDEFFRVRGAA